MSLANRTFRAIGWNAVGTAVRFVAQFATMIVLARLLGPAAFGVIAAATTVVALGALVSDGGFGAATIVSEHLDLDDLASVQSLQLAFGTVLLAILLLARVAIADFFHTPALTQILPVLALQFPIQALGTGANVRLKRELNFRAIQFAQTVAYVVGYGVVGIIMAVAGWEVWSLVAAQLVFVTVNSALLLITSRSLPNYRFALPRRETLRYGLGITTSNLGAWVNSNVDTAVIGRMFGAVILGYYNRAWTLVSNPTTLLVSLVQSALVPAFAQARSREDATATAFSAAWSAIWLVGLPVAAFVSMFALDIIQLLFGDRWIPAAPALSILATLILLQSLIAVTSALLWGHGRVGIELAGQAASLVLIFAAVILAPRGIDARYIAFAVVAGAAVRVLMMSWGAAGMLRVSTAHLLAGASRSVPPTLLVLAVGYGAQWSAIGRWSSAPKLVTTGAILLVAIPLLVASAPSLLLTRELRALLARIRTGREQSAVGRLLERLAT